MPLVLVVLVFEFVSEFAGFGLLYGGVLVFVVLFRFASFVFGLWVVKLMWVGAIPVFVGFVYFDVMMVSVVFRDLVFGFLLSGLLGFVIY